MDNKQITTDRLILRSFTADDLDDIYTLLADEEVNRYLPWFPAKSREEAAAFYEKNLTARHCYAICLKTDNRPVGYVDMDEGESHDFGYALRKELWHQGIVTEAARAVIGQLRAEGILYITATHDRNNKPSGRVMQRLGMKYCYSYLEQWQPKDFPVVFRMYQLNLDGTETRVYDKYKQKYPVHFVEQAETQNT